MLSACVVVACLRAVSAAEGAETGEGQRCGRGKQPSGRGGGEVSAAESCRSSSRSRVGCQEPPLTGPAPRLTLQGGCLSRLAMASSLSRHSGVAPPPRGAAEAVVGSLSLQLHRRPRNVVGAVSPPPLPATPVQPQIRPSRPLSRLAVEMLAVSPGEWLDGTRFSPAVCRPRHLVAPHALHLCGLWQGACARFTPPLTCVGNASCSAADPPCLPASPASRVYVQPSLRPQPRHPASPCHSHRSSLIALRVVLAHHPGVPLSTPPSSHSPLPVPLQARNFLVFQGDVETVASKGPRDMLAYFETFSGSAEWK